MSNHQKGLTALNRSVFSKLYNKILNTNTDTATKAVLRNKTLYYYRRLLIEGSECFQTNLRGQVKVEEFKFIFRESKDIESVKEVENMHLLFEDILGKIRSKEYPPFPSIFNQFD